MNSAPAPRLLLVCRTGSLLPLYRKLARHRGDVVRIETIHTEAAARTQLPAWARSRPPADLWIVTSRAVVDTFLRAQPDRLGELRRIPTIYAVGPDTRRALLSAGFRRVHAAPGGGARQLLRSLGPLGGRRILYLRSDRAGSELTNALRRRGARVQDRVVYRVRTGKPIPARDRRRFAGASAWAVSSPSALYGFRRMLGTAAFGRRIAEVRCFALGERTARALRAAGARHVVSAAPSTQEGFTNLLEKVLSDARTGSSR